MKGQTSCRCVASSSGKQRAAVAGEAPQKFTTSKFTTLEIQIPLLGHLKMEKMDLEELQ